MVNFQAKVKYTTAVLCVEPMDLTAKLIYNNDTNNITITITKPYVNNTKENLALSSLEPGATIYYTLKVIDTDSNTIGSTSTGSFVFPLPSMTPTITTTSGNYLYYLLYTHCESSSIIIIIVLVTTMITSSIVKLMIKTTVPVIDSTPCASNNYCSGTLDIFE